MERNCRYTIPILIYRNQQKEYTRVLKGGLVNYLLSNPQ